MLTVGLDVHLKTSTCHILDDHGKAVKGAPQLKRPKHVQLSLFSVAENNALKALSELDTSNMTPEQALAELLRLKDLARE